MRMIRVRAASLGRMRLFRPWVAPRREFTDSASPRAFTISELLQYQQSATSEETRMLGHELSCRWNLGARLLRELPHGITTSKAMRELCDQYEERARILAEAGEGRDEVFSEVLSAISLQASRQAGAEMRGIAVGVERLVLKEGGWEQYGDGGAHAEVERKLHEFNSVRIGTKLLADVLSSTEMMRAAYSRRAAAASAPMRGDGRGDRHAFNPECSVVKIAQSTAAYVQEICEQNLYVFPEVAICGDPERTCVYVPSHVWYVLTELLKNACRVVIQANAPRPGKRRTPPPPVVVSVQFEEHQVSVEVVDEGPGLPEGVEDRIWSYMFTTVAKEKRQLEVAGAGIGLPLSRLYTEYFGGGLALDASRDTPGAAFRAVLCHAPSAQERLYG